MHRPERSVDPAGGLSKWAYIVSVAVSVPIALSLLPAQNQSTPYHRISAGMKSADMHKCQYSVSIMLTDAGISDSIIPKSAGTFPIVSPVVV